MPRFRVYDQNLNFVAEPDAFRSAVISRLYRGITTLDFTISLQATGAHALQLYNYIYAGPRRVFEILYREVSRENPDELHVIAYAGGLAWTNRITMPPEGQATDNITGSRDAVIKHWITRNAITPDDADRKIPHLVCAPAQPGEEITAETRLKNLFDEITGIMAVTDMGFYTYFDQSARRIIFDTYTGSNRVQGNGSLPPAIFAVKYDNIKRVKYTEAANEMQNVTYIGGQGEGSERKILCVGEGVGSARFETFQDARDTDEDETLIERARADQTGITRCLEAEVSGSGNLIYGQDYDLGDMVTVQDDELGLKMDTRITEIRETYQAGLPKQIFVVFGNSYPNIFTPMKKMQRQLNQLSTQ